VQFDFGMALVFAGVAVALVFLLLLVGKFLRPRWPSAEKETIYECGERPIGKAWFNFNPRFYIVALVFVIFEVEIALTIPVALVLRSWIYRGAGLVALLELAAFLLILAVGLVWIWARRDLEWIKRLDAGAEGSARSSEFRKAA